ncbi:MAG: ABC transporter substrate-binding protein [Atopobiaceae bacterium]|nr:ABC transporter substrate-binding protein [Atopobiaceae bacterium]
MKKRLLRNLSRKTFLRGSLAAAVVAGSAALLTGCNSSGGENSDKKVLRFGVNNPKVTFDTQKTSGSVGVSEAVAESLIVLNPETKELEPNLITSLPTISDDGLTYSFELKEGVKFHNREILKSSDVKYTLTRMFLPATKATSIDSYAYIEGAKDIIAGNSEELTGVVIKDDRHFDIKLTQPYSTFNAIMAQFYAVIYPEKACKEAGDAWGTETNFIGTGAYKLVSNDGSTEVVLEGFADYHEGKPGLDELRFVYIDDANTRMMNYKNGDIDLAFISQTLIQQYQNDESVSKEIVNYTPASTQFVNLNLKSSNLSDVRVRQALSMAIDRDTICSTILSGVAKPAKSFIPSSESGYNDSAPEFEYDVDKAKELLAQAGVSNLTLNAQVRSQDQTLMVALQDAWSKIGVTCNVSVIDSGVWSDSRTNGDLEVTLVTWSTLSFQGVEHMGSYFRSDRAAKKSSFYNSKDFDNLVDQARLTVNDNDRMLELTRQADTLLTHTDYACIPVDWPQMPYALKPEFSGLQVLVNPHFEKVQKK